MYQNTKAAFTKLRNNKFFELSVICVIIISALEIGAKTFPLSNTAISVTSVLDTFITLFFLFEISLRFLTEENKRHFFKSAWNVFDTLVVVISLIPINDSEMALLARLLCFIADVYYFLYIRRNWQFPIQYYKPQVVE